MPQLIIDNIPEPVFVALKNGAEARGLSAEEYAKTLIAEAVRECMATFDDSGDPLATASARGVQRLAEISSRDDICDADEMAAMLGLSTEDVDDLRRAQKMLGITSPTGETKYPRWQVGSDGTLLDGLEDALAILGDNGMTAYRILCGTYPVGGDNTIYESLRDGKKEHVLKCLQTIARGDFF
ncbi:hypothetical protein SLH49_18840 [Cognatiyoonia sp. IB215446]|uniref:hypothetical protein n=1 Tax=Cognatiyoonia sp. IB215446 TaxID=3097355 RepID=UPI002A0BA0D9|nr:hypothetical protein [Cognatiyoonia sp. IB215446]MDX8350052.1 hypothetical protein [Cognatiyoonia sp. IB215446]